MKENKGTRERKTQVQPRTRRLFGVLLCCILMACTVLSAVQPVYADGRITTGKKVYSYTSHGRKDAAFSFSIGGGSVTVESVPQELAAKAKNMQVCVYRTGHWKDSSLTEFISETPTKTVYSAQKISFPHTIPLPVEEGVYNLAVHVSGTDGSSTSYNMHFTVEGGDAFFRLTKGYEVNEKAFKARDKKSKTALWAFSRPYYKTYFKEGSSEDKIIRETAEKIVNPEDSDYEKVKKVHNWVANNIWYDWDYLQGRTDDTAFGPVDVLESKKTVCQGYTLLTEALLRSLEIPVRVVIGYARGGHVWNEAYVDGRWMILDTTWDSKNEYKNGVFSEAEPCRNTYFDISLEEFSENHQILLEDSESSDARSISSALQGALSISKSSLTLKKGKTKKISIKTSDKQVDFKDLKITYTSSNPKVASVNKNGKITAKKAGTATVRVVVKMKETGDEFLCTFETKVTVKK